MNRTSNSAVSETHKIERTDDGQQLAPKWELSDRIAWALGLKVAPSTKLVAVAIAQRAGASSGVAWPGMGSLAADTGLSRSSVIRAVAQLEQGGHFTVTRLKVGKKNVSNRYRLPVMGGQAETLGSVTLTLPPSVTVTPEPVRTLEPVKKEALRAREVCHVCQNSWPAEYGKDCYLCLKSKARAGPSAEDKRRARFEASKQKFLERTGGRPSDTRTKAIDQERRARIRAEKPAKGKEVGTGAGWPSTSSRAGSDLKRNPVSC